MLSEFNTGTVLGGVSLKKKIELLNTSLPLLQFSIELYIF